MTPLMSFWPSVYKSIASQKKMIDYRRVFPKNCKFAYMYVSKPVKAICGIVYFGKKYKLSDWKDEYHEEQKTISRIEKYLEKYRYGMEIVGFQEIEPITLNDLRNNVLGFVAPQSYHLLENNELLKKYIENNIKFVGSKIENSFLNAYPEVISKEV